MWFTALCIKRPVFTLMLYATVFVLGWRSLADMPVELFPDVEFPVISIQTVFAGADPETIEEEVTKPIEDAVATVSGIQHIYSVSQENISTVTVEFQVGEELEAKAQDVREKVELVKRELPQEVKMPAVFKVSFVSDPILFFGMTGTLPLEDLREIAEDEIADALRQINGVGEVVVTGGRRKEVRVAFDAHQLAAHYLTFHKLAEAIQTGNLDVPSGKLEGREREEKVRLQGKFRALHDLIHLPVQTPSQKLFLPLSTFAQASFSYEKQKEITRIDGKEGIGILIVKASRANTVRVVEEVKKKMKALKKDLPPGISVAQLTDNSARIREALSDVQQAIFLGIFLVMVVIYLFLYSLRGTFIVALAIPLSILFAFIPMRFLGITINQMSLLGLALSVGSLVDDAIVVIENTFRHLQRGELPKAAAFQGRAEIGAAALAITLTNVAVFLPVAFMKGIIGKFFKDFGLTLTVATLASLVVSFTLTPSLFALLFRRGEDLIPHRGFFYYFDQGFNRASSFYSRSLRAFLNHRAAAFIVQFVFLGLVFYFLGPKVKGEFIPPVDQGTIGITVEMPQGTSLTETHRVIKTLEKIVKDVPYVEHIFTTVGSTRGGFEGVGEQGSRFGQIVVTLKQRFTLLDFFLLQKKGKRAKSDDKIVEEIRQKISRVPAGDVQVVPIRGAGGGFGAPIEVVLLGRDLEALLAFAEKVRKVILELPGTVAPRISFKKGEQENVFKVDREKLTDFNLSVAFVGDALRTALEGKVVSTFEQGGKEYDVRLIGKNLDRSEAELASLPLVPTKEGIITLGQVGSFHRGTAPSRIERQDRLRAVTVTSYLKPGVAEQQTQLLLAEKIKALPAPGIKIDWGGETARRVENMGYLMDALSFANIIVYIFLSALYNNMLYPLIIMFTIPMALAGVVIALVLTGTPVSIVVMIGMILLVGIVVNNAILLVDYTNTLRQRGKTKKEALLESARTRLRPILMTFLTLVFSLIPTVLPVGPGAGFRSPMAITVLGGALVSTFLALFFIPPMYLATDNFWEWLVRKITRKAS